MTNSKNRVLKLKTRMAGCKHDDTEGQDNAISEARSSRYCPKNSLLKASSKAKRLCETEIKKIRLKPFQVLPRLILWQ